MTETFTAGTQAGAGSFECAGCGFAIALRERDIVPPCPSCAGDEFRRASLFADADMDTGPLPTVAAAASPDWLDEARDALVSAGDYLAFDAGDRLRVLPLQTGWTRIGRSLSAHVRLDDPTVSRRHALIYRGEDGMKALDDRSLNGVFLNGDRIDLAEVADGDVLAVGRFALHVVHVAADRAPQPV